MNFEREGKLSNARAPRAPHAGRKFTKIYGNPRARAVRAPYIDFAATKNTVQINLGSCEDHTTAVCTHSCVHVLNLVDMYTAVKHCSR